MISYFIAAVSSGILFATLDAFINANPIARRLFLVYAPIVRTSVNIKLGILIDLSYGFILAGLFLLLYHSLPGEGGVLKGISFGLLTWFLRVVMPAASQWMMFDISVRTLGYTLVTGFGEMLILGVVYGLLLIPST